MGDWSRWKQEEKKGSRETPGYDFHVEDVLLWMLLTNRGGINHTYENGLCIRHNWHPASGISLIVCDLAIKFLFSETVFAHGNGQM